MGPLPKAEHAYAVVASFVPLYNVLPFKITLNSGRMQEPGLATPDGDSGAIAAATKALERPNGIYGWRLWPPNPPCTRNPPIPRS